MTRCVLSSTYDPTFGVILVVAVTGTDELS